MPGVNPRATDAVPYWAMDDPITVAAKAASELCRQAGADRFDVAVVLGSGWKAAAGRLGDPSLDLPVTELPGFRASGVEGHEGRVLGIERGSVRVLCFRGRTHLYEGHGVAAAVHGVRTAVAAGCGIVVLTNACGAIDTTLVPGEPVLIADHISMTGVSPLVGAQFVDLTDLYAARLRRLAREVDPGLREGVYAHWPGPAFETPAEIRMLRTLGADLVGMSTVPEAIAAHALGAEVLAIALPTNLAAGLGDEKLSHLDVIAQGEASAERCAALLVAVIDQIGSPSSSSDSPSSAASR
jgi:purine-nucleoside phosphorylase